MFGQKLGGAACWVVVCLLVAAAAPLATAARINVVPKHTTTSIFKSISVFPPMVGSGSEVDVTVELKEKASAPEIYTITSSSGSVECENVTFANNTKTATTTCEVDPGCEIGSYKLTVTASLNDSKTSIDYHVACKNDFDRDYGPFKVVAPGCQNCFQDCVTKLFTCKTCPCKCVSANVTSTSRSRFPTKKACESAAWCTCDDVEGIVVKDHRCELVRYDNCDNSMKCKLKKDYYESHKRREYREPEYEEMDDSRPGYDEEYQHVEEADHGDAGEHRGMGEGEGSYGNRGPRY